AWAILVAVILLIGVGLFFMARSLLASPLVTVRNVINQPVTSAEQILQRQGFHPAVDPQQRTSNTIPAGRVIDYNPKKAHEGDTITLIVSSGRPTATPPNVVCEDRTTATNDLKA